MYPSNVVGERHRVRDVEIRVQAIDESATITEICATWPSVDDLLAVPALAWSDAGYTPVKWPEVGETALLPVSSALPKPVSDESLSREMGD